MGSIKAAFFTTSAFWTAFAQAHGHLCSVTVGETVYHGVNDDAPPQDELDVGWHSSTEADSYFGGSYQDIQVYHSTVDNSDFTCGQRYRSGSAHAPVAAGSNITVTWCGWPTNHRGAIFDYLAPCNGDCNKADPSTLEWSKIGELGLIEPSVIPHPENDCWDAGPNNTDHTDPHIGYWATDILYDRAEYWGNESWINIPDNTYLYSSPWQIVIPQTIKPGKYVLRTEIFALFLGTQLYPRCINLEITGNGTEVPQGVTYDNLYDWTDPETTVWYKDHLQNWTLVGPELYAGAASPNPNLALVGKNPPESDIIPSTSPVCPLSSYSSVQNSKNSSSAPPTASFTTAASINSAPSVFPDASSQDVQKTASNTSTATTNPRFRTTSRSVMSASANPTLPAPPETLSANIASKSAPNGNPYTGSRQFGNSREWRNGQRIGWGGGARGHWGDGTRGHWVYDNRRNGNGGRAQ